MKGVVLLTFFIVCSALSLGVYSKTIFDGHRAKLPKPNINDKFAPSNRYIRHINTFRVFDSVTVEKVRDEMLYRQMKRDEEESNERNIWRSHPQKADYKGPDTTEVIGLNIV